MMQSAELDIQPPVTLEQLIGKGQDLPSLPEIYLRVSEQLEDEGSTVQQIGDTVQNDPAITTRVLKMVNSAYYGMPNEVASVSQAVSLLGRERLKHILMARFSGASLAYRKILRSQCRYSGSTVSKRR